MLNVGDKRGKEQRDLYLQKRTAALNALETSRYDEGGPEEPASLAVVRAGRARAAAIAKQQQAPGLPIRRSAWYWEQYEKEAAAGTEFLVFVRIDVNSADREAIIKHYTTPMSVAGAKLLPVFPGAAWLVDDLDKKTVLLVSEIEDGALRAAGVQAGDLLVLDGTFAAADLEGAVLGAARGEGTAKMVIRRGRALDEVVQLAKANEGAREK
jgi:hypothetical protein